MSKRSLKNTWLGVSTIKSDIGDLGDQITNNWNNTVKNNTSNIITTSGSFVAFKHNNNNAQFMEWKKPDNTRIGYIGKASTNDEFLEINSERGALKLRGKDYIDASPIRTSKLEMGVGSARAYITAEDATNKELWFSGVTGKGRMDLNMNNMSKILNLPNPTQAKEASTKEYVDNKVNGGWTTMMDSNFTSPSQNWNNDYLKRQLNLGNNYFEDNKWYEVMIQFKTGDIVSNENFKFQKLAGQNWTKSNMITFGNGLGNENESRCMLVFGNANSGSNWRDIKLAGILKFNIDKVLVKIRKID